MITTYYIISPKGEIMLATGAPSKARSKRLFLNTPIGKHTESEVEKQWRKKRRDGYNITEQPFLFT